MRTPAAFISALSALAALDASRRSSTVRSGTHSALNAMRYSVMSPPLPGPAPATTLHPRHEQRQPDSTPRPVLRERPPLWGRRADHAVLSVRCRRQRRPKPAKCRSEGWSHRPSRCGLGGRSPPRGWEPDMKDPRTTHAPPERTVVPLDALGRDAIERGGGKGANLGELIAAGLPVPPGFCVTTAAYRQAVVATGLARAIDGALHDVRPDDPASAERAAARIAVLFQDLQLPEDLGEEILGAYRTLGMPPVAVRSSATAEDLPGASFAGQHATSLNVRGADELLDAVRDCWASLWSARALAYRERRGFRHDRIAIAVVVQRLIVAEVSGVLFTANPVNGARDEIIVNAAPGLGEAVVGGSTTPDSFVLDRATLTVRERRAGRQEVETVLAERGTQDLPLDPGRSPGPTLTDAQLAALARIGLDVEGRFASPQDLEWAYAEGRFWVLQARPITNLPPEPLHGVRWEPPFPGSAWWRRQVVENLPEPLSPLFDELYVREGLERSIDAVMELFEGVKFSLDDVVDRPLFTTINGFAYSRANYKLSWRVAPQLLRVTFEEFRIMFGGRILAYWHDQALP